MKKRLIAAAAVLALLLSLCALCLAGDIDTTADKTYYDNNVTYTFGDNAALYSLGKPLTAPGNGGLLDTGTDVPAFTGEPGSSLPDVGGLTLDTGDDFSTFSGEQSALKKEQAPAQLTIEDIRAMNPGATVVDNYSNEGYLSLLLGKFYDKKVTNEEEGIQAIQGMCSLLGLTKGCEFFAVYSERSNTGYTFYTYQQRYGRVTLRYATLRIIVDPEGYTAGLSCSFVPNVGTSSQEPAITADMALEIVKRRYADLDLTYYPEKTVNVAAPFQSRIFNCFVIYTSNPYVTPSFDMPYLEHYVTTSGEYATAIPTCDFVSGNETVLDNDAYFEGMEVSRYTTTVTLEDGTRRNVDVPVCHNPHDGLYYLMDPERKITVAQYYEFNYENRVVFVTSPTIDGWSQNNLLAYANYIIMYDFYADHGIRSVDGFETPILITVGWCDQNRKPVDNACFYGVNNGWACFGISDINHYGDALDVVGHEYTHGITRQSMQSVLYRNETGAINEAYSDIMGNLAEMSLNYTEDRDWQMGEKTGETERDMRDPNRFRQPAYVGDQYYKPSVIYPYSDINDNGGVHDNNSLMGHIAYLMDQTGMTYEQQISMWLTAIEIITPRSDYSDLHGALLFSLKINGMLEQYGPALNRAFAAAGLNDDWNLTYMTTSKPGCGRVSLDTSEDIAAGASAVVFYDSATGRLADVAYPDVNGFVTLLLPAGSYTAKFVMLNYEGGYDWYGYTGRSWAPNGRLAAFTVEAGTITRLRGLAEDDGYGDIELVPYDGGYFSMLVPDGWRVEINGQYTSFSFKLVDPDNPSTVIFYYAGLAPYHKSAQARQYWARANTQIGDGPLLSSHDIIGVLDCWSYTIEYQKYYERQYFPDLYNIRFVGGTYFTGKYSQMVPGTIESACFALCDTDWDSDCYLTITSSLMDYDIYNYHGGYMFYTCRDLFGILAPADRYADVFDILTECLTSLRFTDGYIKASQTIDPMATMPEIIEGEKFLVNILTTVYHKYGYQ